MTEQNDAFEEVFKAEYIKTGFVWDKEHARVFFEAGQRQECNAVILKEWIKDEFDLHNIFGFLDIVIEGYQNLAVSRFKKYRFAMPLGTYGVARNATDSNRQPALNMVRGGHGELFGYPVVLDESVECLLFEEYE